MSSTSVALRVTLGTLLVGGAAVAADRTRALRRWRDDRRSAHPDDHGLAATTVRLRAPDGPDLHGWWVPAAAGGPAPTVLVVHGFASHGGDLLPLGARLHAAGFNVLMLDLRGHGRSDPSPGPVRPQVLARDARAAASWLRAREDVGRVGVVGHSMGGAVSIFATAGTDDFDALVSVAGVASPLLSRIGWWPSWTSRLLISAMTRREGLDGPPEFAVDRIRDVTVPTLLVHGAQDRVVPVAHARALHRAASEAELLVVAGAGHASFEDFAPALERSVAFLREALLPAGERVS